MTEQFYYPFIGYGGISSRCLVKIFSDDGQHMICFEDIGEGTSVTNVSEELASDIVNKMDYNPSDCKFFESYKDAQYNYNSLDEIEYNWEYTYKSKWVASNPNWAPAAEDIEKLFINDDKN